MRAKLENLDDWNATKADLGMMVFMCAIILVTDNTIHLSHNFY